MPPSDLSSSPVSTPEWRRSETAFRWVRKALDHPFISATTICGLIFTLVFLLWQLGLFQFFELQLYDRLLRTRPRSNAEATKVTIIGISEEDIQSEEAYPVPDDVLLEVLEKLMAHQPAAVVVDLYRDLPVPGKDPEGTKHLADFWIAHENILAIERLGLNDAPSVRRPRFLHGHDHDDQVGFNDFSVDYAVDDTARRALLLMDDGKKTYTSVALLAALLYLEPMGVGLDASQADEHRLPLGKAAFTSFEANDGPYVRADSRGFQIMLDFRGPAKFPTYSLSDLRVGRVPPDAVRGNVVLIGLMANSLKDHLITPLAKRFPGVLMHAHVVNQLLRDAVDGERPIRSWNEGQESLWLFFWSAVGTVLGLQMRSPLAFVVVLLAGLGALLGIYRLAFSADLWLPAVAPGLAFACGAVLGTSHRAYLEKNQRDMLMQLFSRHVSANIAMDIWRHREQFMDGHRPKAQVITGTVFFTDLEGFSAKAEALPPDALLAWLNEYMEVMAALVEKHGGMVNKYMGDAIMAVFGAPIPRLKREEIEEDATNAVRCALAMGAHLDWLNASWAQRGLPTTSMRVGIATGDLISGTIGGAKRLEYTVTGDTVVTAKRLESAEKQSKHFEKVSLSCRVLIAENTYAMLGSQFKVREVGPMQLEGKHRSVGAYVVTGFNPEQP